MAAQSNTVFVGFTWGNNLTACAICQHLREYGYDALFVHNRRTYDRATIHESIMRRTHFVLLLTPSLVFYTPSDSDIYRDIEQAIASERPVIPLTFRGFDLPLLIQHLPDTIAEHLMQSDGLHIASANFESAMQQLRDTHLSAAVNPVNPPQQSAAVTHMEADIVRVIESEARITDDEISAEHYLEKGQFADFNSQYEAAIRHFSTAIARNPDFTLAYNNRGVSAYLNGDTDAALADYNRALQLSPGYAEAYNNRGIAHRDRGDIQQAITDFSEAIALRPMYAHAYNNRGNARIDAGHLRAAIDDFSEAIRLSPNFASAYSNRACAYDMLGQKDAALRDLQKTIQLDPSDAIALQNIATIKQFLKKYGGASWRNTDDNLQ